jgi:hypothetical protein
MNQVLLEAMKGRLEDGRLPCNHAFAIAKLERVAPFEVGSTATEAGIRISRCQLGLFGYGPKAEGKHKIVHAMENVPERLAARLRALSLGEEITCANIWKAADGLGYRRLEASGAVEAMGLRVSRCQLGCFPRPWVPEAEKDDAAPASRGKATG